MNHFQFSFFNLKPASAAALLTLSSACAAAEPPPWPPVEEVLQVVRTNLPALDEQRLQAGAVQGLLAGLAPDVLPGATAVSTNLPVAKLRVYDGDRGYLRVGRVDAALPTELAAAHAALARTNALRGLVLDLRFAGGTDFAAVPAAAAVFTGTNRPALRLGDEVWTAPPGAAAGPALPVMVLVNHDTAGAAEALAAAVRHGAGRTLVLGAATAGQARDYRTITLSTGARLRIAGDTVAVVDGPELGASGVRPDLAVTVDPADEKIWFADEYRAVRRGQDVAMGARRFNEADLVRLRRGGRPPAEAPADAPQFRTDDVPATPPGPRAPVVVQDPVLARALDLLAVAGGD